MEIDSADYTSVFADSLQFTVSVGSMCISYFGVSQANFLPQWEGPILSARTQWRENVNVIDSVVMLECNDDLL